MLLDRLDLNSDGKLDAAELAKLTPDDVRGAQVKARSTLGMDVAQFSAKFASRIARGSNHSPEAVFKELDADVDGFVSRTESASCASAFPSQTAAMDACIWLWF